MRRRATGPISFRATRLALATALLASLAGCLRHESVVDQGNRTGVLHRGLGHDLADLDPHLATQASDYDVLSALLEGLVAEDPVDLHPVPGVAERWEISADRTTYTFFLRASARWSNGDPVTAQDFIASWRRVLTPALGADNANLLYVIQGAEAFHKGLGDFQQVGLAAPDARTLRVTLEHPTPYFLPMLNHTAWFPVHLPTVQKYGSATERGNPWAQPGRFVGNGPFVLEKWRRSQEIVVTKSPTYWDAARVRLAGVTFHTIDSVDAEERAFRAGQLHLTASLPPGKIAAYRQASPSVLRIDPLLATYFYRLNVRRPLLNDVRIRRALALAVDRDAIVGKILRGGQLAARAFTPPGTAGYASAASLPTDFAQARALLADAGYPGGRGLPPFELTFNSSETHRVIAEAVQEMWRRELGVETRLANQELKSTLEARRAGNFSILRSVWNADYVDPSSFLDIWRTDSGNNYTGWSNPAYDSLLFQAARTVDAAERNALFQKAEALLLDEAPMIPIYHYTHVYLCQPSVRGWHPTLLDHHPYRDVWLQE
ncbi:MAG: transporter substrate-binding protein [Verrucomicrobia bacterium]|nr:transporter substrate-binding protein [Verrucomicrobiota bacterium]